MNVSQALFAVCRAIPAMDQGTAAGACQQQQTLMGPGAAAAAQREAAQFQRQAPLAVQPQMPLKQLQLAFAGQLWCGQGAGQPASVASMAVEVRCMASTPCGPVCTVCLAQWRGSGRRSMLALEAHLHKKVAKLAAMAVAWHVFAGLAGGDKQLQQGGQLRPVQPASPQASTAGRSSSGTPLAPQARGLNGNAAAFVPAAASPLAAGTEARQQPPSTSQPVIAGNALSGSGFQAAAARTGRSSVAASGLSGSGPHARSYRSSAAAGASAAPSEQLPSTSVPLGSTSSAGLPLSAGLDGRPGSGVFLPSTSSPLSSPTQADAARQHVGPFSTKLGQQSKQGFRTPPQSKVRVSPHSLGFANLTSAVPAFYY